MRYFKYETKEKQVNLYPLVCIHAGAEQCDVEFIKEHMYRIKHDPWARIVYMGDGGECVTRLSKGDVFSQTMNPTEQLKWVKNLLEPYKNKLLFGIDGNHGRRTFKETGLSWDETLCLALQVPYFGTAAMWNLQINRSIYSLYTHHGIDSGVGLASKVNKAKALENLVICDAILSAHSHICCEVPPLTRAYLDTHNTAVEPIKHLTTRGYMCGCAYDSRTGYAEEKGYPPILPAWMKIEFGGKVTGGRIIKSQNYTIWRKEV